jgi:tetratricopeptide (TPR) repeat protein
MRIACFVIIISCILFSCNNKGTSSHEEDAAKNALNLLLEKMQQQLQQFPDSPGLRLQYAFTLDSVEKYKEALAQMDTLIKNDSANYGLLYAQGQIAEDAQDTILALKSYSAAAGLYESPDVLLALANLYAEMKNDRAILFCSRVKALALEESMMHIVLLSRAFIMHAFIRLKML